VPDKKIKQTTRPEAQRGATMSPMRKLFGGPGGMFTSGWSSSNWPSATSSFWTQPNFDAISGGSKHPYHQIGDTGTGYFLSSDGSTVHPY
jgi:hypothetical protein